MLVRLKEPGPGAYEMVVLYSISVCYQKIYRRFEHPWSTFIYKTLKGVKLVKPFKIAAPKQVSELQCPSDLAFLRVLLDICKGFPAFDMNGQFSTLLSIAKNLPPKDKPLLVYTERTHQEFHDFFILLLDQYLSQLKDFQICMDKDLAQRDVRILASNIYVIGYALWKMASSRSFETYLRTISTLLEDPHSSLWRNWMRSDPTYTDVESNLTSSFNNDFGDLWRVYRDWVMLMVVHFEAAHTLRRFFRGPHYDGQPLSIKILLSPPVSRDFLPLYEYLNSEYFPADAATKAEIIGFIKNAISIKEQSNKADLVLKHWTDAMAKETRNDVRAETKQICSFLTFLYKADPVSNSDRPDIQKYVNEWPFRFPDTQSQSTVTPPPGKNRIHHALDKDTLANIITLKISEKASSLAEARYAHKDVEDCNQLHFNGTLHCESCLASLLDPSTREILAANGEFENILKVTKVSV